MILGFIGLGLMGESMSLNLVKKSKEKVVVFDINKYKVDKLVAEGAEAANSDIEVVQKADVVFTSVPKSEHVESVINNVKSSIKKGQIFIEMSTIHPSMTMKLAKEVSQLGGSMLDCPIVKSKKDAISGTLGIYVGGDKSVYEKIEKYLYCIGSEILYTGESGSGIIMKICHNMLVAEIQNSVNEMITLSSSLGIDIQTFKKAVGMGGAKNAYIDAKAEVIDNRDFTTAFSTANMNKDVHIAKELMEQQELNLRGVNVVVDVYEKAIEVGLADADFASTFTVVEEQAKNY